MTNNLNKHEVQLRDMKDIKETSMDVNLVVQSMINEYNGCKSQIISITYQTSMDNKYTTNYIKEKWKTELNIEVTEDNWIEIWTTHQTSTSSRAGREFSCKNLSRFFITPKQKCKQVHKQVQCWRACGDVNVDHAHVFWKCHKIGTWKMIHK